MKTFRNFWVKSSNKAAEDQFQRGVGCLKANDHSGADQWFRKAAAVGHVSALYNLFILHGAGLLTPYDIDFAAACYYEAVELGHAAAKQKSFMMEAADRGGFGHQNLSQLAASSPPEKYFNSFLMVSAARYFKAVSDVHGVTDSVIAYELRGAYSSDYPGVRSFIERTGVPESFFLDSPARLEEGMAADQITDGLNYFSEALRRAGNEEMICVAARCSIVGYMVSKSRVGRMSKPLLGLIDFYRAQ